MAGGGLVVVLLAGYAVYAVRKKRKPKAAAASDIDALTSGANSVFGPAGGASIDTNSSLFQSDFAPEAAAGESEEIDPIAEADVYMAYGRDAQAEEILKEALAKDPSRNAVRMKLLEIYSNRKDVTGFNALAGELHRGTGGQGAEWEKAAALGAALDPSNLLYGGGSGEGSASPTSVTDTQVLPGSVQSTVVLPGPAPIESPPADEATISMPAMSADAIEVQSSPAVPVASPVVETASPALDFDLDLDAPQPAAGGQPDITLDSAAAEGPTAESGAAPSLDFDLNLDEPQPSGQSAEAAQAKADDEGFSIDFELPSTPEAATSGGALAGTDADAPVLDFDLGTPGGEDKPLAEAPALDLSTISLDLGAHDAPAAAPDARWQEVATKLDLAKAYQEMGDKEGARELLKEVLNEGDDAQQQQARTMIEAVT
jgi:pilus assembly protein FimV